MNFLERSPIYTNQDTETTSLFVWPELPKEPGIVVAENVTIEPSMEFIVAMFLIYSCYIYLCEEKKL